MAFTIGKYGVGTLGAFGKLICGVYLTSAIFIFLVLGIIARVNRFSLWKYLKFFKDEILITFATASSEAVLPRMMVKLEQLGCAKPVVGLVLPAGYTFNADGTSIYLTMGALFVAQATGIDLSLGDQLVILAVALFSVEVGCWSSHAYPTSDECERQTCWSLTLVWLIASVFALAVWRKCQEPQVASTT